MSMLEKTGLYRSPCPCPAPERRSLGLSGSFPFVLSCLFSVLILSMDARTASGQAGNTPSREYGIWHTLGQAGIHDRTLTARVLARRFL